MKVPVQLSWKPFPAGFVGHQVSWSVGLLVHTLPYLDKDATGLTLHADIPDGVMVKFYVQTYDAAGNYSTKVLCGTAYNQ